MDDDLDQLAGELEGDAFNEHFEAWCDKHDIDVESVGIVERWEILQDYRRWSEEQTSEDSVRQESYYY